MYKAENNCQDSKDEKKTPTGGFNDQNIRKS